MPSYMVQSILATLLCCLPVGIAGIVFSSQASSKQAAGDYAGALAAAKKAKTACFVAVGLGVVVVLLGLIGLGVIGAIFGADVERDETGAILEEGDLDVFDVQIGDCLDGLFDDGSSDDVFEVQSVRGVPCTQPHDVEVSHLFDLPEGEFPGQAVIDEEGAVECEAVFEAYVGISYEESEFGTTAVLFPTEESWDVEDDREVVCGIGLSDEKLTESVKDSGR